ncbi:MAG: N-6 DNA methylase [Anaerolineaceae bacterium]
MKECSQKMLSALEKITGRYGMHQVFDDFLDISLATLEAIPAHLESARTTRELAQDTPETQALWEKLRSRYDKKDFEYFTEAFAHLMGSTSEWQDALGEAFMLSFASNARAGQFFTPFHVSQLMSKLTFGDIEAQLRHKLYEACGGDMMLQMQVTAGYMKSGTEQYKYFIETLLPQLIDKIEPIKVCDPCIGSGGMILAVASETPRWALDSCLVTFYGQDIDLRCIKMCKINLLLYGLNGEHLKWLWELSQFEVDQLPEELKPAAREAQGVPEENREQYEEEFNNSRYQQSSLFGTIGSVLEKNITVE